MEVDRYFQKYEEVTPQVLREEGVKLLLCDLDYTLVPRWISRPTINFVRWLANLEKHANKVVIVSNNRSTKRIETFVETLHSVYPIPYVYRAAKPGSQAIMYVIKNSPYTIAQTALLGDRMHTDIAAANYLGIKAWKVPHRLYP